ncbi:MAG TPA: DUF4082 domain-containing protein [Gemmatimonadaceae bacterium]
MAPEKLSALDSQLYLIIISLGSPMRIRYLAGLSLAIALATAPTTNAQTLGVTNSGGSSGTNGSWSLGYFFDVTSPFTVNYLGFWDDGANGLSESHQIGLWDPFGNLLATATVDAGTGDLLVNSTRLVSIDPITLSIGAGYRVAGVTGSENYNYYASLTNAPGIVYTASAYCAGTTLQDPTCGTDSNLGYFGGNFAGLESSVPEPASIALLATGLVGIFGAARRRRGNLLV